MSSTTQLWRHFKAKVIMRFGSIRAAAQHFECTEESLRLAVRTNKCGGVRQKLEAEGMLGMVNQTEAAGV